MSAGGDFVICWHGRQGNGVGIYAQRYNSEGEAQGTEFAVNSTSANGQVPSVAMSADGNFVVSWVVYFQDGRAFDIYAQRYDAEGVAQGGEFRVNTTTTGNQTRQSVAMSSNGDFVVAWESYLNDVDSWDVYAQRFNATGELQGPDFRVNSTVSDVQQHSSVAMSPTGDFVVTCMSPDGSGYGIYAQQYDETGLAQGGEIRVNTTTNDYQYYPSATMPGDDNFVIVWMSPHEGTSFDVYAQRYAAENGPPTVLALTGTSVDENRVAGTVVGTFSTTDPDASNTFTYTLVSGTGDTGNGSFLISSNQLVTAAPLNCEGGASYSVRVRTTDQGGLWTEETFTISVGDLNEPPSVIDLDRTLVPENELLIGAFSTSDPDAGETDIYSLVPGPGDTDNSGFLISGWRLASRSQLSFETQSAYSIRVRITDQGGLFTEQTFTITVTDVDEFDVTTPVDIDAGEGATVAENLAVGAAVGITVSASDADGTTNTVTYILTTNPGNLFAIDATTGIVTLAAGLNYETGTSHTITVQAQSSDGSTASQAFTITVTDVDEFDVSPINDNDDSVDAVAENSATGTAVGVTASASDADGSNNTVTYLLTNNAGGRFAIDPVSGIVTVANGPLLDFEIATSHVIEVRATSADGSSSLQTFTINVTNVNEGQQLVPTTMTIAENLPKGALVGELSVTDSNAIASSRSLATSCEQLQSSTTKPGSPTRSESG